MNIRHITLSLAVVGSTLLFLTSQVFPGFGNQVAKENVLLQSVVTHLDRLHFEPLELNEEFSEIIFLEYINRLDGNKRFLTEEDFEKLKPFEKNLHREIKSATFEFFNKSNEIMEKAIERSFAIYNETIESDFDFETELYFELDPKKIYFPKNELELMDRWYKYLHYQIMDEVVKMIKSAEKKEEEVNIDEFTEEGKTRVKEQIDQWFERVQKQTREDRFNIYLNTIGNVQDPHTGYFKPKDKQDFDMRMSNQLEGIGARLSAEGDYVKIVSIVPGGPAWKQGDLQPNDLIIKVAQEDEEAVEIAGWSLDDVVSIIRGAKGTKVTLTVRKIDGKQEDVEITRDVVVFEEGFARSLILEREDKTAQVGYINLPSFYFNIGGGNSGRNSKDDVKAELEKLKEENVDGIILDLRNNGGGSLNDVVDMSGFFFDKGPVVQVKSRTGRPMVLEDEDEEVVYDGPLIVMVNSFSASASEILAAALQDYGRAIIVGGRSTFGKGTVQRFYNLDRTVRNNDDLKPLGEVKITTQKFYRINGGSTQLQGVVPDIILPDNFQYVEVGESDYDYAMEWSEIDPVPYHQDVFVVDKEIIKWLEQRSKDRISEKEVFNKILANSQRLKDMRDQSIRPLNLEGYREFLNEREERAEKYKDMFEPLEDLIVENLEIDLDHIQSDSSRIARNQSFVENIQKDVYLYESIAIMDDLLDYRRLK